MWALVEAFHLSKHLIEPAELFGQCLYSAFEVLYIANAELMIACRVVLQ